jgi:putative FmdB family regulatory protein
MPTYQYACIACGHEFEVVQSFSDESLTKCPECKGGQPHICRNASELIGWQRPGGYAEYLAVPAQCLLPVPDDIPDHLAPLLLDTIGTAGHGVRLARKIVDAGRVLVLGAGQAMGKLPWGGLMILPV